MLAQPTQIPVMQMPYEADPYWALKSWERFLIPAEIIQTPVGGTLSCP